MDLPPTGSDKILEIQSGNVHVVIKSKNLHPSLNNKSILQQPSNLMVTGTAVKSVKVFGKEKNAYGNDAIGVSSCTIRTSPLFFEQMDYEVIVKSSDGKSVALWHENYSIRDKISPITDSDDLISGIINFGNSAGFSDIEIFHDNKKCLVIRIEVFPSKLSYKEDYQKMLQDISNEIAGAVLDFMRNTYQEFSYGATQNSVPVLFFQVIKVIFDKLCNAAHTIIAVPHHKLCVEHAIVPTHKVKKIDSYTIQWLKKHPEKVVSVETKHSAIKAPMVKKQITYNTVENQYSKFILKSTSEKLKDFRGRYICSVRTPEQSVLRSIDTMIGVLNKLVNSSFLREVDDYKTTPSMSLVFEMAPGYRELNKYFLMIQRGLSVHGDIFRMSLKDTARLYEYWCFIKLVTLMKRNYQLVSPDVIKVDNTGVTVNLVKGKKSEVRFINPRTGETIVLAYNPGEQKTQTVSQKPDNVLTLEKKGTNVPYKYIFDAKYHLEINPSDPLYPDAKPGPQIEDINAMHRYRDAIVYEADTPSRFMFEKTMFGAYVLFPYDDPDGEYKNHRFYKSIEAVNIGGLPFLPGTTELLENLLAELIADSSESAFERASLPRGIEDKLQKADWHTKNVMVGTVRTQEQLQFNLQKRGYYTPAQYVTEDRLPIKYIALHGENIGGESGIKRYGEVLTTQKIRRVRIPVALRPNANPDELYYYFTVRQWLELPRTIPILDSYRGKPQFTTKFLLDHATRSYQLFAISSEEEYRLMMEINKAFGNLSAVTDNDTAVYHINDNRSVIVADGYFTITNANGDIIDKISVNSFAQRPRSGFNKLKKAIE